MADDFKRRAVVGLGGAQYDTSSESDDDEAVVRYAKTPKRVDQTNQGRFATNATALVNEFIHRLQPDNIQCWDWWQRPEGAYDQPVWSCKFEMVTFEVSKRVNGQTKTCMVPECSVLGYASKKAEAQRQASYEVLKIWEKAGLVDAEGRRMVDISSKVTIHGELHEKKMTEAKMAEMQPFTMASQNIPWNKQDGFIRDRAGVEAVLAELGMLKEYHDQRGQKTFVAIDAEWRAYAAHRTPHVGPVSILQLCYRLPWIQSSAEETPYKVFVFHLPSIGGMEWGRHVTPKTQDDEDEKMQHACRAGLTYFLLDLLQDLEIIKIGVNVWNDVIKMAALLPANTFHLKPKNRNLKFDRDSYESFEDIQPHAKQPGLHTTGLDKLVAGLFNLRLEKGSGTTTDWEQPDLSERSIQYAALDVLATYMVGKRLIKDMQGEQDDEEDVDVYD